MQEVFFFKKISYSYNILSLSYSYNNIINNNNIY